MIYQRGRNRSVGLHPTSLHAVSLHMHYFHLFTLNRDYHKKGFFTKHSPFPNHFFTVKNNDTVFCEKWNSSMGSTQNKFDIQKENGTAK